MKLTTLVQTAFISVALAVSCGGEESTPPSAELCSAGRHYDPNLERCVAGTEDTGSSEDTYTPQQDTGNHRDTSSPDTGSDDTSRRDTFTPDNTIDTTVEDTTTPPPSCPECLAYWNFREDNGDWEFDGWEAIYGNNGLEIYDGILTLKECLEVPERFTVEMEFRLPVESAYFSMGVYPTCRAGFLFPIIDSDALGSISTRFYDLRISVSPNRYEIFLDGDSVYQTGFIGSALEGLMPIIEAEALEINQIRIYED